MTGTVRVPSMSKTTPRRRVLGLGGENDDIMYEVKLEIEEKGLVGRKRNDFERNKGMNL